MKNLPGHGGQVLYLDYDGVLHHEECWWHPQHGMFLRAPKHYRLFQHAQLLAQLLAPYPALEIVLSTSWVERVGLAAAVERLPSVLGDRVVGSTSVRLTLLRGEQVYEDVKLRKPASWLALDDKDEGWPDHVREHVVFTHPRHGISHPPVRDELERKLAERFGSSRAPGATPP